MKRTNLATAVIAGIVGVAGISNMANAVFLNQDGLGQVLVYPYYTVNGGNSTLLSVVNTTSAGKAVKVRFLEAYDSREVLDFNLYMSPFDVWVAQVVPVGSGAGVFTNDNSCTVPVLARTAGTANPFSTAAFDGELGSVPFPTDQGPTDVSRTLEGYIELIEMGEVVNTTQKTLASITHTSSGVPKDCTQVNNAWAGGYWTGGAAAEQTDITSPAGGLFGSGSIINVNRGGIAGYNAVAIDQFYGTGTGPQHSAPTDLFPSIASGTSVVSYVFENGQLATTSYAANGTKAGRDAVSSLFMADQLFNEYVVAPTIGASTEWVVNFPTKRFYVDPNYVGSGNIADEPFDQIFGSPYTVNLHGGGVSCSPVTLKVWNREEQTPGGTTGFSPAPVHGNALCYETQVITFGQAGGATPSTILGSHLSLNIPVAPYTTGWARLSLTSLNHVLTSGGAGTNTFYGLPVTGFSVTNYVNGTLTDSTGKNVQSNYTALYNHKYHRTCNNGTAGTSCS